MLSPSNISILGHSSLLKQKVFTRLTPQPDSTHTSIYFSIRSIRNIIKPSSSLLKKSQFLMLKPQNMKANIQSRWALRIPLYPYIIIILILLLLLLWVVIIVIIVLYYYYYSITNIIIIIILTKKQAEKKHRHRHPISSYTKPSEFIASTPPVFAPFVPLCLKLATNVPKGPSLVPFWPFRQLPWPRRASVPAASWPPSALETRCTQTGSCFGLNRTVFLADLR